ncbi:ribonuclease HIII [Ktedonobacter racemifer]|uniref:Ribonuclease n=1 Tax=Ktedonobacter racemifer DSM 44963 TaxID=485913 RepID=D6TPL3_KTERA|nr:ribonuclease HIII [Ktedonobacter racemifer]EFH85627.1 ribonuclease HIII [Ktedonobacter racemifer DSM 44963]
MPASKLETTITAFHTYIADRGWRILSKKAVQSGYQFVVSDGKISVPVTLYTTGRINVQGQANTLQSALKAWSGSSTVSKVTTTETAMKNPSGERPRATGLARIGCDESGKGDYYGPLVMAALYVDNHTEEQLLALGVRDSKRLTDAVMLEMASEIERICRGQGLLRIYDPERYNQLYQATPNLNLLLAQAHAHTITRLQPTVAASLAIVDQFGAERLLLDALRQTGCSITLEQRPRAEDDTAVAAASIMARAAFVRELAKLSRSVGIELPKGASNPQIVAIGRELVAQHGADILRKVAKLHFKTTDMIVVS